VSVIVLGQHRNAVVECVEFSFLALAAGSGVLSVFPDRQADSLPFLAPFEVIGPFWVLLRLVVNEDEVGFDAPVRRKDDRAIPHAFWGLDAFGEVYFFGLCAGHR
jgi:hypothetical protein